MKYSLRSLMIAVLVLPPLLAGAWLAWRRWREEPQYEEIQVHYTIFPAENTPPSPEDWTKATSDYNGALGSVPNSSAPATNPAKP